MDNLPDDLVYYICNMLIYVRYIPDTMANEIKSCALSRRKNKVINDYKRRFKSDWNFLLMSDIIDCIDTRGIVEIDYNDIDGLLTLDVIDQLI